MSLIYYDDTQTLFDTSPLRAAIDGHVGGAAEVKFYIRNDDVTKWYTNVVVKTVTDLYDALGESGTSGISIKFIYGENRPTEAEWDVVLSGQSLTLPNIGDNDLADTFTYHPIWVRISIPGNTPADIIDSMTIRITAFPRVVGS